MCAYDDHCGFVSRERWHQQVQTAISRYAWAVQWIEPTAAEPCFAYTVGLTTVRLPELIVFGLSPALSAELCNQVGEALCRGADIRSGTQLPDEYGFPSLRIDPVTDTTGHLYAANDHCGEPGAPVRALQIVWADQRGWFPDEPGTMLTRADQILLG